MKTDLWACCAFGNGRCIAGANLDRITRDARRTIVQGEALRPVIVLSLHSSPTAADRYAERLGAMIGSGWFIASGSAQNEAQQMEESE